MAVCSRLNICLDFTETRPKSFFMTKYTNAIDWGNNPNAQRRNVIMSKNKRNAYFVEGLLK